METQKPLQGNSIGRILFDFKKITDSDIQRIIRSQKSDGSYFGETAVKLGLASREDVEMALAYQFSHPYLGAAQTSISKEVIAAYAPYKPQVEELRKVRTALLLSGAGQNLKAIGMASCHEGAGKTFMSANLAVLFAQLGKKTLLMDFNLRNPKIHTLFEAKNSKGVSTLLINRSNIDETIHKTNLTNLDIMPAGPLPPNPLELISRKEAYNLVQSLKNSYEVIIVNSPALTQGQDCAVLASFLDAVLIVASQGKTLKEELGNFKGNLEENGARILGVVLNQRKGN